MSRILAIDWDRLEARALLLQSGPTGSSIVGAWAEPLSSADGVPPTAQQIGSRLASALGGAASGSVTTLVGVGRDQVQMKLLALPPAPPEELPDLVRFQAEREFTTLGDDAALDFIPLSGDAATPHQVLAAALAASGLAEVNEVCSALGVEPDRITLRATAAASFVARRSAAIRSEVCLVANRLTDEADLTVLADDQVVLVRTVRLSDASDETARDRALAGEIRRTVASVRQQLSDRQLGRVILCGNVSEAGDAAALADEIGMVVEVFDVAEHAPSGLARAAVAKDSVARFAALLGMALGEADRRPPVVDFLNVRRCVEPARVTRTRMLAAAVAAAIFLAVGLFLWQRSAALTRDNRRVTADIAELEAEFKQQRLDKAITKNAAIERWLSTDVNWLDELYRFSQKWRPAPLDAKEFPVADDAMVTQLTAFRPPGLAARGGSLDVQAVAKSPEAVATLEQRLRDENHRVAIGNGKQDRTVPGYVRSFVLTMDVPATREEEEAAK